MVILRRLLAFLLSFVLIFSAVTASHAASPAGWVVTKAVSSGARVIATATNTGYKSAINIAPNAGRIASSLAKLANRVYLVYAVSQLFDGIDWVLDEKNNSVKIPSTNLAIEWNVGGVVYPTKAAAMVAGKVRIASMYGEVNYAENPIYAASGCDKFAMVLGQTCNYWVPGRTIIFSSKVIRPGFENIPLDRFARDLADRAAKNDAQAQKAMVAAAIDGINAGDFDRDLMSGAVPGTDKKPLVPAVPGSQVGDIGAGVVGGDVGAAADDARAAADDARAAAAAAKDAAKNAADDARAAADDAKDLINSAVDQALKDIAASNAKDAAKAAEDAAAVSDAASSKAADATKAAADTAAAAADAAKSGVKDAKSALDAATGAGDTAAIAAAEKALAAAKAKADAADAAAVDAKAKADAAAAARPIPKAFELPAFCNWAAVVCDAVDWLQKPEPPIDTELDIESSEPVASSTDINFGGSCPANFGYKGSIFGNQIDITLLDTSALCRFLSVYVKYPVYAVSSLYALYIFGGRKNG